MCLELFMLIVCFGFTLIFYRRKKCKNLNACSSRISEIQSFKYLLPSAEEIILEKPRSFRWSTQSTDSLLFFGVCKDGIKFIAEINQKPFNQAFIQLKLILKDGTTLKNADASKLANCQNWGTDSLTFEVVEPMKTWRIVFNGTVENCQSDTHCLQHLRINLLWHALSRSVMCKEDDFDQDYKFASSNEQILVEQFSGYEQWGTLIGNIQLQMPDGTYSEQLTHLQSLRQRRWSYFDQTDQTNLQCQNLVFISDKGDKFSFIIPADSDRRNQSKICGHLQFTNRFQDFIKWSSVTVSEVNLLRKLSFSGKYGEHNFLIRCSSGDCETLQFVNCESTFEKASGFLRLPKMAEIEFFPDLSAILRTFVSQSVINLKTSLISLDSINCCKVDLVGGKAASLAFMKLAQKRNLLDNVSIPDGICLTTFAMEQHLKVNNSLRKTINELGDPGLQSDDSLESKCKIIDSLWMSSPLSNELVEVVNKFIQPHVSYAVRSSGIHEDGQYISAAGQNETILSVTGLSDILQAVRICWASLFSFRSVKYRRQNGLPLASAMGVVIQEMVQPEAAGVLFTRHPMTGDPSIFSISAIEGLGDAVVSGKVNPDSFVVSRRRSSEFTIIDQKCGNRSSAHNFEKLETQSGCKDSDSASSLSPCLSEAKVLTLCKLGALVESIFGYACDIEWALLKDKFYLLQARPITSLRTWTNFEIIHEFDSPYTDDDIPARYNAGEAYPIAVTPLTITVTGNTLNHCSNVYGGCSDGTLSRYRRPMTVSHYKFFINIMMTMFNNTREEITFIQRCIEVVLCGKVVCTEEHRRLAERRNGPRSLVNIFDSLHQLVTAVKLSFFITPFSMIRHALMKEKNLQNVESKRTTEELLPCLQQQLSSFNQVGNEHLAITGLTYMVEAILIRILIEDRAEFTEEVFSDITCLLTNCNTDVLSLQLPLHLQKICESIKASGIDEEFCSIPSNIGEQFLAQKCTETHELLLRCKQLFGHRGINELELMADNWLTKQNSLIELLQSLVKNNVQTRAQKDFSLNVISTLDKLKTPKKPLTRKLLRIITPLVRRLVAVRESSKSRLVRSIHDVRIVFRALGEAMVKEGSLPDSSLMYFMSFYELTSLMHSPDCVTLQKAFKRQRLWSTINKLVTPEMAIGWPLPLSPKPALIDGTSQVKGMPVCSGQANGRACVVKCVDECKEIQNGDILVTQCIDIGWSPYFPLLRGLVIEFGGVLSHGVVIVREFGLPCIVDATDATNTFCTGDPVFLDADRGVLCKVSS